ncbi:hypothetical protein BH23ACT12_BH23ACT12_21440 [soil metagenome]
MMIRKAIICLLALLSLAACGEDPREQAYERLQNQVVAIRDAAEARDATTALQRLVNLRADVAELRADGVITEPETQKILTAALQVQANLPLIVPPPPAIAPPPAPAPAPAGESNAGGSIRGADGEEGEKGNRGKKGDDGDKDD